MFKLCTAHGEAMAFAGPSPFSCLSAFTVARTFISTPALRVIRRLRYGAKIPEVYYLAGPLE